RRGSLRVATTVPTTRDTSIEALLLSLRGRLRLANRQYVFQVLVRPRDDVHRDQLAHAAGRSRAGVCGGLDGGHVAAQPDRHGAGPDLSPTHHHYLSGFPRRIGGLDHGHEASRLDHSKSFTHETSRRSQKSGVRSQKPEEKPRRPFGFWLLAPGFYFLTRSASSTSAISSLRVT